MAYDTRPAYRSDTAEPGALAALGLGGQWREQVTTGIVVAVAVMIVALIAVLMGMA